MLYINYLNILLIFRNIVVFRKNINLLYLHTLMLGTKNVLQLLQNDFFMVKLKKKFWFHGE